MGILNQFHCLAGKGAEFARELHHRTGVGHPQPQRQSCMGRVLGDLLDLLMVVVGHQGLVLIEFVEGFDRLDRVGVDDPVPDEGLPLLGGQIGDELVNGVKLLHARHIKAAAEFVERVDNGRIAVDLHGVVDLNARKVLAERRVVPAEFGMVDDKQRRAVLLGQLEQCSRGHGRDQSPSDRRKFLNCQGSSGSICGWLKPWKALEYRLSGVQSDLVEMNLPK